MASKGVFFGDLLTDNPFSLGFIERMIGYSDKQKIRVGSYRIGITIDKKLREWINGWVLRCERYHGNKNIASRLRVETTRNRKSFNERGR